MNSSLSYAMQKKLVVTQAEKERFLNMDLVVGKNLTVWLLGGGKCADYGVTKWWDML